ncbi:MAG: DUF4410 domain-containing protein [Lentisphaeria bacterium]|nr:DUF4410 domain-containing protein [Lentisphaeria bacterium]
MKWLLGCCLSMTALMILSGCAGSGGKAVPLTATGVPIHIDVLSDRGDPSTMEEKQWRYRNEVGAYMEPNLVRRLGDYKFSSALIQQESDFKKQPGTYLLKVSITSYNPGSAAARIMVGYGAGACSLDCEYELIDAQGQSLMKWTDGIGTSGDWRRLPVALNKRNGQKIRDFLVSR